MKDDDVGKNQGCSCFSLDPLTGFVYHRAVPRAFVAISTCGWVPLRWATCNICRSPAKTNTRYQIHAISYPISISSRVGDDMPFIFLIWRLSFGAMMWFKHIQIKKCSSWSLQPLEVIKKCEWPTDSTRWTYSLMLFKQKKSHVKNRSSTSNHLPLRSSGESYNPTPSAIFATWGHARDGGKPCNFLSRCVHTGGPIGHFFGGGVVVFGWCWWFFGSLEIDRVMQFVCSWKLQPGRLKRWLTTIIP